MKKKRRKINVVSDGILRQFRDGIIGDLPFFFKDVMEI